MRITDTMQSFVSGENDEFFDVCAQSLVAQWSTVPSGALSPTFALLWSSKSDAWIGSADELASRLVGPHGTFDGCRLEKWRANVGTGGAFRRSFRGAVLIESDLSSLDLRGARFAGAWLESVSFAHTNLESVDFGGASLLDVDFSGASVAGADFRLADPGLSIRAEGREYEKERALGWLTSRGALVPAVSALYVAMAHPHFDIAQKIARRLCEGGTSQLLGLTQRGVSSRNPDAARSFVDLLTSIGYAVYDKSGSARTVDLTVRGRIPVRRLAEATELDDAFRGFFGAF